MKWIETFSPQSCKVWLTNERCEENLVAIKIKVYAKHDCSLRCCRIKNEEPKLDRELIISDLSHSVLLSNRSECTWRMVQFFSKAFDDEPLPVDARQKIIEEVFSLVAESDLLDAPSYSVINVEISALSQFFQDSAGVAFLEDAISSMGLEKVIVDSRFLELEDSCAICMEDLIDKKGKKYFKKVNQPKRRSERLLGLQSRSTTISKRPREESSLSLVIARLPCAHQFHGLCIFQWLRKNHACPLCRHKVAGAGQPSQVKWVKEKDNLSNISFIRPSSSSC